MSENMIESEILINLTRDEVKDLLGEFYYLNDEDKMVYEIGSPPGLLVLNPDILVISFKDDIAFKVTQETAKYF